jgi:hypothetical protein
MAGNKLLVARAEKLLNTFKQPVNIWSFTKIADVDARALQNFPVRCLFYVIGRQWGGCKYILIV